MTNEELKNCFLDKLNKEYLRIAYSNSNDVIEFVLMKDIIKCVNEMNVGLIGGNAIIEKIYAMCENDFINIPTALKIIKVIRDEMNRKD